MTPRPKPPSPISETVAKRVRQLRQKRGLTVREVAERLAEVGAGHLDRAVLTNLELGRRQAVTVDELAAFASVFGVKTAQLLLSDEEAGLEQAQQLIEEWDQAQDEWRLARSVVDGKWTRLAGFIRSFPELQQGIREQLRQSSTIRRLGDSDDLDANADAYMAQALAEGGQPE